MNNKSKNSLTKVIEALDDIRPWLSLSDGEWRYLLEAVKKAAQVH